MIYTALGFMSGTSMDGVDAAIVRTDGKVVSSWGETWSRPFQPDEIALLRTAMDAARSLNERTARPLALQRAEALITQAHIEVFEAIRAARSPQAPPIDLIGFHGQTVFHDPAQRLTIQLGDGQALADATGVPVVYDFRAQDVAMGGQGAPLVPVAHRVMMRGAPIPLPLALVNIGGVANVTLIGQNEELVAFDTGPGNALIDDWVRQHTGQPMDVDGALAAQGQVQEAMLAAMLQDPYFSAPAPKSMDRNHFQGLVQAILQNISPADGAATLTALTARSIKEALSPPALKTKINALIVCGGGARNPSLMRALSQRMSCPVLPADLLGLSSGYMEAQAFAILAVRALKNWPISFPTTTGAPTPLCGGVLAKPLRAPRAPNLKPDGATAR